MAVSLADFISPDAREALARPVEQAESLPAIVYTSGDFARLENERLFPRLWVFAGYAHDIAGRGDIRPVTIAGRPILLLRDREDGVRAYLNSCGTAAWSWSRNPVRTPR